MDGLELLGADDVDTEKDADALPPDDFEVEEIITHDTFENCVSRCIKGEIMFDPETLREGKSIHSKNVFLIHWKGYSIYERTWEPEQNLLWLGLLDTYKEKHNIDHTCGVCETIKREYNPRVYEKMTIMNKRKTQENQYNVMMEKESAKLNKKKEGDAVKTSSPVVKSTTMLSSKARSESSTPSTSSSTKPKEKGCPGVLNEKERRCTSEVEGSKKFKTSSVDSSNQKRYETNGDKKESKKSIVLNPPPLPSKKARIVQPVDNLPSSSSGTPKATDDQLKGKCRSEHSAAKKEKKKLVKIRAPLPCRSFDTHLELRTRRRCTSAERLNTRWDEKCELELFNRRHFLTNSLNRENEPRIVRELITGTQKLRKDIEKAIVVDEQGLITRNNAAFLADFDDVKTSDRMKPFLKKLVARYTLDMFKEFKDLFEQIPPNLEAFKFLVIQSLILRCKTFSTLQTERKWRIRNRRSKKKLDLRFVETDEDVDLDQLPHNFNICSPGHFKCTWLGLFLSLLSPKFRFLVSSGKRRNDMEEDGPFRDDIFMHCMHYGADCQKFKFLLQDCTIGNLEDTNDGNVIDHMHIVATQGRNLKRIQTFIKLGFDVNAMAKIGEAGHVVRLADYLEIWVERVMKSEHSPRVDLTYYRLLIDMIRNISSELEDLMFTELFEHVTRPTMGAFQVAYEITPPHILHCSPVANEEHGGRGENQVLSCLFNPCGCSMKSGLPNENRSEEEEMCAKKLGKIRKALKENRGRMILAVLRVEIETFDQEKNTNKVTLPRFKVIPSDEGFSVEKMTILRQGENLMAEEADLQMVEHKNLSKPGRRFFVFDQLFFETDLLLPGMAHIEFKGHVEKATNFLVQLVFFKHNGPAVNVM